MKTKFLLATLLLLTSFYFGYAQDTGENAEVWSMRKAIDFALEQSLVVKRSEFNTERFQIDFKQSKYALLPTLNGSATHGYSWGRSIDPVTNSFTTAQIQSNQLGAQSSLTLFNGLRLQNNIKQGRYYYEASVEDLAKTKNDVILNVANLYINVVFNKELLQTTKLQVASTHEQLTRTKSQVAAGAVPRSNELQLEAQLASNELDVINQENSLALSLLQLKQAMQLDAGVRIDVEVPEIEVEDLILDQSRDEIFESALRNMPEIRSAKLKIEGADFAWKAERGNYYPMLTVGGSVNTNYSTASDRRRFVSDGPPSFQVLPIGTVQGTNQIVVAEQTVPSGAFADSYGRRDQFADNLYKFAGFTLSIPILNGMQTRLSVQRAVIVRNEAEVAAQEVRNELRQSIESAYNSALSASKTYVAASKQVAAAEEAFRMLKQRYDIGAANFAEYQVSNNDFFRAQSDLSRAKYNYIFTKKVLDFYQNKPIDF